MKNFEIDKNSWHYKLNKWRTINDRKYIELHSNFCDYWRMTFASIFIFCVFWSLVLLWIGMILYLMGLYVWAVYFYTIETVIVSITFIAVMAFIKFLFEFSFHLERNKDLIRMGEPPRSYFSFSDNSLFVQKVRSMKEKVCPKVTFVNKRSE